MLLDYPDKTIITVDKIFHSNHVHERRISSCITLLLLESNRIEHNLEGKMLFTCGGEALS